jgi:RHS repeat-associated protein
MVDHLGAPRMLLDEAGEIAWKAQLDVYGVARTDVAHTGCPWRWPGQYEDEETGLYYNRCRYFDPEVGRYISQDPIGITGSLSVYEYTHDPTTWIDPLGLDGSPFRRPISWPSWKKVLIDMEEVSSGHMVGGWRLAPGNMKDIFPADWSAETVERAIREAYQNVDTLISANTGFRRLRLQGPGKGYRIEFWFNKDTGEIETAYPKGIVVCGKE